MAGPPLFVESFFDTIVGFGSGGKAKKPKAPKAKNPHHSGDESCAARRKGGDGNEGDEGADESDPEHKPQEKSRPIKITLRPTTGKLSNGITISQFGGFD